MSHFHYLVVGHFSRDITESGVTTGGSVAYAGATAWALGCRTAILTSFAPDFEPEIAPAELTIEVVPAAETTTFRNVYRDGARTQYLYSRAALLTPDHLPRGWETSHIVHLAPVAGEVDPDFVFSFADTLLGITPQGWLRAWEADGRVYPCYWEAARELFPLAAAVVLSDEDIADHNWLRQFRQWARLLVLTHGAGGCTVYMGGEERLFPAPEAAEADPTGAGDIFAAAFFLRLAQTYGNPWEAARFANSVAARSVSARDLHAKIGLLQQGIEL